MTDHPEGGLDTHRQLDPVALETELASIHHFNGVQQLKGLRGRQRRHGIRREESPACRVNPIPRALGLARKRPNNEAGRSERLEGWSLRDQIED